MFLFEVQLLDFEHSAVESSNLVENHPLDWDEIDDFLTEFCEWIEEYQLAEFHVQGFDDHPWPTDVSTDLLVFLEQLPDFVSWTDNPIDDFALDFYEQGIERRLWFRKQNTVVSIRCESWGNWSPAFNPETASFESLICMVKNLVEKLDFLMSKLSTEAALHPSYLNWRDSIRLKG